MKPIHIRARALVLAAALLLLLALPLPVSAGTDARTTVSAVVKTAEILCTGDTSDAFRVAIDLSLGRDAPGIAAYIVTVRWDPNVLELVTSSDSYEGTGCYFTDAFSDGWKLIPDGTVTVINTERLSGGQITVTSGSAVNRTVSDGTLFVLCFRPRTAGIRTTITVSPGSANVPPSAALSSASGRITNVTASTTLSIDLHTEASLRGDVNRNGRVDSTDYMLLKRYVLGTTRLSDEQMFFADVDRNGKVNSLDYVLLKRHVLGTYVLA